MSYCVFFLAVRPHVFFLTHVSGAAMQKLGLFNKMTLFSFLFSRERTPQVEIIHSCTCLDLIQHLMLTVPLRVLYVCVYLGSAQRYFRPAALWPVWPQRSIPGPAAGQRVRWTWKHALPASGTHAGPGGGPQPSGCAETGHGSLQEDAGEDDGTAVCCWEKTQEGE